MSYVNFFGDVHFSSMNPWNRAAGDNFIDWFKERFKNENKQNYAIFDGDIFEKDTNPGLVIDQAQNLFMFCNSVFRKTYVLTGNHDEKLYKGVLQNALKFLNRFENVEVIETVKEIQIENRKVLALPHMRTSGVAIEQYYNSFDYSPYKDIDVTIGHWTAKVDGNKLMQDGVDLTKIPSKHFVLGHIHNRVIPEYCGSCWPNKANEMDEPDAKYPRCIKIWNLEDNTILDEPLPIFLSYENIEYPNKIEEKDVPYTRVFTVYNIKSKLAATDYYAGHYIRGTYTQKDTSTKDSVLKSTESDIFLFKNNKDAFAAMIKEQNLRVSRQAIKIVTDLL